MRGHAEEFAAAGARLLFVGTGLPAMAADFAREHVPGHVVLADPQRRTFAVAGMRRSPFTTLHWRLAKNLWRALRSGFRQGRVQGDAWQQGGVLVCDARGAVLHRQVDRAVGDPIDVDALRAAVRA